MEFYKKLKLWQQITIPIVLINTFLFVAAGNGWFGTRYDRGIPTAKSRPFTRETANKTGSKQILFGDLHVHTTFSIDAFTLSLPIMSGEGAHPPADACDFARFCSALDFWSINDHAEALTPYHWKETKESIRQCNAISGDESNPDMVSFLGWEWTQVGTTRDNHYGHKNVILLETEEDKVPKRAIASLAPEGSPITVISEPPGLAGRALTALFGPGDMGPYHDFALYLADQAARVKCNNSLNVHKLPDDCLEGTVNPDQLFEKLNQWDTPSMVIPHGTTWGFYTPMGTTFDKQLAGKMNDNKLQILFEIFSGHGNSDVYRPWRAAGFDAKGKDTCPEPGNGYLPSCWRAGEIILERCLKEKLPAAQCEKRAETARQNYVDAGIAGHLTVQGESPADWLNAGQCTDCYLPAFNYRPGNSAQYTLAITNFDKPGEPRRFKFGFMASSDNHFARPGTGYKEFSRRGMTESISKGVTETPLTLVIDNPDDSPIAESVKFDMINPAIDNLFFVEVERQGSFFTTGGLIAAHSAGRDRKSIWDAMKRREVYGTSGERMLLWFDLLNSTSGKRAMGSEVNMKRNPGFTVKAVGSLKQNPGCPDYASQSLSADRLQRLCKGECYNPTDTRNNITHIEIIRVLPQIRKDEPIDDLIQDPWRTFQCKPNQAGCQVSFTDNTFAGKRRDAVYYVRAIQESHDVVNGDQLACEYDSKGKCSRTRLCKVRSGDDCLAKKPELAWSSPIFINYR